jgi:hypothetical protein
LSDADADSVTDVPRVSSPPVGAVNTTVGGVVSGVVGVGPAALLMVMETGAEIVWFPAASLANARNAWLPLLVCSVLHTMVNGAAVSSPTTAPSNVNWTRVTPTLSEADASSVTADPVTVTPAAGEVMVTVGGVVSDCVDGGGTELLTVTVTAAEVVRFPAASLATARNV